MKIIVVPHTHWDREWYFTNETSTTLLNFNLDNCLNYDYSIKKFYLDGQVSLVDDYFKYASNENKNKLKKLINEEKIIIGPLYSQPDVFNSLGETTIRNIEIAKSVSNKLKIKLDKIIYCPDTFGFGFNFPQIINLFKFDGFVFWRGLSKEDSEDDFFLWEGIDKTIVKSYRFKHGYWSFSSIFPWNTLNKTNIKLQAEEFLKNFENSEIYKHLKKQSKKYNDIAILPFGGDQAPINPLTNNFIDEINKISSDDWIIGDLKYIFENTEPSKKIFNTIDYGYESKIHRTISSSRYDFKKLFRENEISLYHQLEHLEVFYKLNDEKYFNNNDEIIKTITLMQAHDILGGCVTDNVYLSSYQKLENTKELIESKKNLLMKQIAVQLNLDSDNILIFNPNTNNNSYNVSYEKIYTKNQLNGIYINDDIEIIVLSSKKYEIIDDTYESNLIFINKKIKPFSYYVFNLDQLKPYEFIKNDFNDYQKYLNFIAEYDNGDLFDADPLDNQKPTININVISSELIKFGTTKYIAINGYLIIDNIKNNLKIKIIKLENNDEYINIYIDNNLSNITIKWKPKINFENNINFLQHLGVSPYKERTIENWIDDGYKENPINIEKTSGLIFDNNNYICTRGNNEFSFENNELFITLYRSVGILGKENLKNRPGVISGLANHHLKTPLAQLHKKLEFNFKMGDNKNNINEKLNSFFKSPIVYHVNSNNLIKSKMEKFIILKKDFEINSFNINFDNCFVSSLFLKDGKIRTTLVNFCEKKSTLKNKELEFNKINIFTLNYEK